MYGMNPVPNLFAVIQRMINATLAARCPYGVDDVYVTFSATEPANRWPGTSWERITDCFLRAANDEHPAGMTGGAWEHEITNSEMSALNWYMGYGINQTTGTPQRTFPAWSWYFETGVLKHNSEEKTMLSASPYDYKPSGVKAMNIENKYTAANMWRRTA